MGRKWSLVGLAGRFGDLASRVVAREQRGSGGDRIVAELVKGNAAIIEGLAKHRRAMLGQLKKLNAGPELIKGNQAILAELERVRSAVETNTTRTRDLRKQLASTVQEASAKHARSVVASGQEAEKKVSGAVLAELRRMTATVDTVGAVGLAQWQVHNPDLARSSLVQAMLARRRAKRGATGSTGLWMFFDRLAADLEGVSRLYERLADTERDEFLKWIMLRYCGVDTLDKGELQVYQELLNRVRKLPIVGSTRVGSEDMHVLDLNPEGIDLQFLRTSDYILVNDFCLNQYHHPLAQPRPGDVLLDLGAYTGDTAVMFGYNTRFDCKVHSFELSNANIEAFEANLRLNPRMRGKVEINRLAVSDTSGATVAFEQGEHAGQVFTAFRLSPANRGETIETITVDDYVEQRSLSRVDMIKMDIEGAERLALRGAVRTIARFKPRLAISIYHLEDDLFILPKLILDANPNYRFGFKWCDKKRKNEAVLFATDEAELSSGWRRQELPIRVSPEAECQ